MMNPSPLCLMLVILNAILLLARFALARARKASLLSIFSVIPSLRGILSFLPERIFFIPPWRASG